MKINDKQLNKIINYSIKKYLKKMNSGDKHKIEENIPKINYKIPSYSDTEYVMKYINEGLITTYPYEKVIKSIKRKFYLYDDQVSYNTINNDGEFVTLIYIMLPNKSTKSEIGDIDNFMNTCGYFRIQNFQKIEDTNYGILIYEPKYSHNISEKIRKECSVIYHSTPNIYLNKILKNGLVPSHKNALFFYPDRSYCMLGDYMSKEQLLALKNVQMVRNSQNPQYKNPYDDLQYSLLTIDVNKIPKDVKMYSDPMAPKAFFTYDIIPSNAIINITPFTLNNNI